MLYVSTLINPSSGAGQVGLTEIPQLFLMPGWTPLGHVSGLIAVKAVRAAPQRRNFHLQPVAETKLRGIASMTVVSLLF